MQEEKLSPMMAQWDACKKKAGDALLLFRMGDFYESFHDDAKRAADALDLTLTKRQEIPMCGVPAHTIDSYLDRLVAKGYTVALAEQMEDPKKVKGLVKRDLVRILSPGTMVSSGLLSEKAHHFFVSIAASGKVWALSALDLSCNLLKTTEFQTAEELLAEVQRLNPKELLLSDKTKLKAKWDCAVTCVDDWLFDLSHCTQFLKDQFKVKTLDGFGLGDKNGSICSTGALLNHIKQKHLFDIQHLKKIVFYNPFETLYLDPATIENLDLLGTNHSLLSILDRTLTPMGGRCLREWILRPLLDIDEILNRQAAIKTVLSNKKQAQPLYYILSEIKDIERLSSKVSLGLSTPKELLTLAKSLEAAYRLKPHLQSLAPFKDAAGMIYDLDGIPQKLLQSLKAAEGEIIAHGISAELDEYRKIAQSTRTYVIEYQNKIKEETGIKSLKIGFNRMFGYYIEVSRGQSHLVPPSFERRQTLVNQERYVNPELRAFEQKVFEAEEKIEELEKSIFENLLKETIPYHHEILTIAEIVGRIDTLLSLALVAEQNNYTAPIVDNSKRLKISDGRHPVIETLLPQGGFVPNDTEMDDEASRMYVITGPNMAGKSTFIRQVALIVLMAQIGSFVPAREAHIGLLDRIFTRIGASDDLGKGQSTFMKEMTETANILNNLTERSLVILDEIGRGTSTYDGISIAWSCAEYLLGPQGFKSKTLFATHYFELTRLENEVPGAKNYHSAIRETEEGIYFLRKIIAGGADKSYGIHVAKLAGIPQSVITRAHHILHHLEETSTNKQVFEPPKKRRVVKEELDEQLLLF